MEEDERVQKLRAGKEKLAQFQKKKKKKKHPSQQDDVAPQVLDVQVSETMDITSANLQSVGASLVYDSDQQSQGTCSEDESSTEGSTDKTYLQVKARLQEKSMRVEELEESLVGKQLALDKVIRENVELRQHAAQATTESGAPVNMAENKAGISGNQPIQKVGNKAGHQQQQQPEFDLSDVQELLHHVQWLQLQLKQANGTMNVQNEKQKVTGAALNQAREEILVLKDNIEQKDQVLSQLAEKLTSVSTQHQSLKAVYQDLLKDTSDHDSNRIDIEVERTKEILKSEYEDKLERYKVESLEETKALTRSYEDQLTTLQDETKIRIDELEVENVQLKGNKETLTEANKSYISEIEELKLKNDSLSKSLAILNTENENSEAKLDEALKQYESLKAGYKLTKEEKDELQNHLDELLADNTEINAMTDKINALELEKEEAEVNLNQLTQILEDLKSENDNLLQEIQNVSSEAAKFKEDNSMYQTQLSEHEDNMSQHADIMEENHSLRMQNDELYNKINNQKDIIASLKGELDVITCENGQLVNQLKEHTAEEEKFRKEIGDMLQEREQLILDAESSKAQLDLVLAENLHYKDSMVSLESEISKLKQNLNELETTKDVVNEPNNTPLMPWKLHNEDNFSESIRLTMKPMEEQIVMPETIIPVAQDNTSSEPPSQINQENVIPCDNIVDSIEEDEIQRFSFSGNGATDISMSFNPDQTGENQSVVISKSAKTSDDNNAEIEALKREVEQLREQLNKIRTNNLVSDNMSKSVTSDLVKTDRVSDSVDAPTLPSDYVDMLHVGQAEKEIQELNDRIQNLEEELQQVKTNLQLKQELCEDLQVKLRSMSTEIGGDVSPLSNTVQLVPEEVSEHHLVLPSFTTSDLEVNMHASSTRSQHGTFSTELSDSVTDHSCEQNIDSQSYPNQISDVGVSSHLNEQVACNIDLGHDGDSQDLTNYPVTQENKNSELHVYENNPCQDVTSDIEEQDCIKAVSATELTVERPGRVEKDQTDYQDDNVRKSKTDFDNHNKMHQEISMLNDSLNDANDRNQVLQHETEKLQWERDELQLRLQDVENDVTSMKTVICDKEFEEEKIKEDYTSVKERLDYLESSAADVFEMKEMVDKMQEEKESVLMENENLQCSLSAAIEKNEQLLKSLETFKAENVKLLEELSDTKADVAMVTEKIESEQSVSQNIQSRLLEMEQLLNEQETKFSSEIEGLLEENSTLKTKALCIETVLESVRNENERLNSLFPSIDSATEENKDLKLRVSDLENKISETSAENETLVKELMEQESKLRESSDENETVINKCEELERIIEEMDDEKTDLLNTIESHKQSKIEIVKEKNSVIEKFEMQLSGLDEENSTLKTLISGLKQDIEESKDLIISHEETLGNLEVENDGVKSQNAKLRDKVISLEQNISSLQEQSKSNEQILSETLEAAKSSECTVNKSAEEIILLTEKCSSLEHDNLDLKNQKQYLKEQLKIYENSVSSSESNSQEVQRLGAQLELETKYKAKLQKDLERHEEVIDELEKENTKLNDRLDNVNKLLTELNATKQTDENLIADLSSELEEARMMKDEITTELNSIDAEYQTVVAKNGNLEQEVHMLQGNLQAVSENRNHIRSQTEVLVSEIEYLSTCRDSLSAYVHKIRMQNRDLFYENHKIKQTIDELTKECEFLKSENAHLKAENSDENRGQSNTDQSDENSDDISEIPDQLVSLSKAVEDLNEQLGASEKEKEELENLTEELTNMLRDMQTKYEEVKSEMESTKKNCDKEISQLQTQLQVMNEDVLQLRKMLDMMENEMYHAAEEKTILKENLEQQQIQYVEAVEQKQMLEEILSDKGKKDQKNLEMASKRNQVDNNTMVGATSVREGDNVNSASSSTCNIEPCDNEIISVVENILTSAEAELVAQFSDEDTDVPTFEHAFHYFNLQNSDAKFENTSVQTDISLTGDQCLGTDSEKLYEAVETQTDIVPQNQSETGTQFIDQNCSETGIILNSRDFKTNDLCLTESGSQTVMLDIDSVSCQTDIDSVQKSHFVESEKELTHEYEKETDCSTADDVQENISVASLDSGILSVSMCVDSEKVEHLQISEQMNTTDLNKPGLPANRSSSNASIQTEINEINTDTCDTSSCETQTESVIEELIAEELEEKAKLLEDKYKEKIEMAENEIENRLLKKFEFRERMVKSQEDNYDKKVKQVKYDLEEEFEFKFREREAELMVEADHDKKRHAKEVEQEADLRIEKIKKEKDQQFVETLQTVKRDLAKRQKSKQGSRQPSREAMPGPEGAVGFGVEGPGEKGDNVKRLQRDNEDLASARDALLHKISLTQQEQSAFHENIISIMGEQETMRSSLQLPNQKMPSWLDWELVPDISFDSMTSSIDSKSLSGSLDLASFCNKSDCLSIRMKYEQLMEKIQQYLKIKSSHTVQNIDEEDETNPVNNPSTDGTSPITDRFVEHKEADSQMLHRLTSIDLEHFVRAPSGYTGENQDQFVQETEINAQPNDNIIDAVLGSQNDYNKEGQFSENESENEEDLCDEVKEDKMTAGHFVPIDQSKPKTVEFRFPDNIEGANENDINLFRNIRRHFSESDVTQDRASDETAQSNFEGHFVLEKSPSGSDSVVIGSQRDQIDLGQPGADDVFKPEIASVTKSKPQKTKKGKHKKKKKTPDSQRSQKQLETNTDKFIVETNQDEASPGSESVLLPTTPREPHTGEESGDFFEEKIVKAFHASVSSEAIGRPSFFSDSIVLDTGTEKEERVESGDILETITKDIESQINRTETNTLSHNNKHSKSEPLLTATGKTGGDGYVTHQSDEPQESQETHLWNKSGARNVVETKQNLETDLSNVNPAFSTGKQSYENTVFDILNSICPGTDPSRIPGKHHQKADQFQATADEFSEIPKDSDIEELKRLNNEIQIKFNELEAERDRLNNDLSEKEAIVQNLESKLQSESQDVAKLETVCIALEDENNALKEKISHGKDVEIKITKLKTKLSEMNKEKDALVKKSNIETEQLKNDKMEVENALLVQADMYDKLLTEKKHFEAELLPKNEELENNITKLKTENEKIIETLDKERHLRSQLQSTNENLNVEMKSLKEAKNELNAVVSNLKCDVLDMQNNLQSRSEEITQLEKENAGLKERVEQCLKSGGDSDAILQQKEREIKQLLDEKRSVLKQVETFQQKTSDLYAAVDILTEEVKYLTGENLSIKSSEKNLLRNKVNTEILQSEKDCLCDQLNKMQEERDQFKMDIQELAQNITSSLMENNALQSSKETNNPSLDLKSKVQNVVDERQSLLDQLNRKTNENNELIKTLQVLREKQSDKDKNNVDLDECDITKESVQELQSFDKEEDKRIQERLKSLSKENDELKMKLTDIQRFKQENISLNQKLSDIKEVNKDDEWAIKELANQIESLQEEKRKLEEGKLSELKQKSDECENLKSELAKLSGLIEVMKQENDMLKSQQDIDSDSESDVQILKELKEAVRSLESEKSALEREVNLKSGQHGRESASLSNEIEKLQEENDSLKKKYRQQEEVLKKENKDILKMYNDLRTEVEVLVISKHDLEIELHALKDLLEQEADNADVSLFSSQSQDTSRELTMQDLEEMNDLKSNIEKLKSDLKEKDNYVRKLEEHLLNINRGLPDFSASSKPPVSKGEPAPSRRRKRPLWLEYGRRAYSHDQPVEIEERKRAHSVGEPSPLVSVNVTDTQSLESSVVSEKQFVAGINEESSFKSSVNSLNSTAFTESFEIPNNSSKEDGHSALSRKQFELVDEITTLRRDFRETKALYAQEAVLLTEALEKEKAKKEMLESSRDRSRSGSLSAYDVVKLRKEIAVLKEENKMLRLESERWILRLREQEQIVVDLKNRLGRNTSGFGEIEEVFGRQLALLQKQREELIDQLKERDIENCKLSTTLGERGIIEESLRRDKDVLLTKLEEKNEIENELREFKVHFEKQAVKRKQMEEIINQKDQNEIQLMKQKRLLEEELQGIESKFKDKEENLEVEKNRLLNELRETRQIHISTYMTEDDGDHSRAICSDGAISLSKDIGKLEKMLGEVEKQHNAAVKILREQLQSKHAQQEKNIREEHSNELKELRVSTSKQVQ